MMKKYIFLSALALGLVMTACSDDDYTPGPHSSGAYFDNTISAKHYFDAEDNTVTVTLSRTDAREAATVGLVSSDESGLFNVPSSVNFAAGASTADIAITFDPTKVGMVDYPVSIAVATDDAYQYGATSYEFVLGFKESLRWEDYGTCKYRDDLITTFSPGLENAEYDVPIQRHASTSGLYRLVNPYGEWYPFNEPGDYAEGNHYMVIHAENANAVYADMSYTGCNWGIGEFVVVSYAGYLLSSGATASEVAAEGVFGRMVNGVITFPAQSWLIAAIGYNNSAFYYANNNGLFRIVLPGASVPDEGDAGEGQ